MYSTVVTVSNHHPFQLNSISASETEKFKPRKWSTFMLQGSKHAHQIPQLHAQIIRRGHGHDSFSLFELIRACSRCNAMDYAAKVFHQIARPNVYLYTVFIDGLVSTRAYLDAIQTYSRMVEAGVSPDSYVVTSVLKACVFLLALEEGREIHGQALKLNLGSDRSVGMKLLELYGKCGEFPSARHMFDEIPGRDAAVATVLISCYLDHGLVETARSLFDLVQVKDTVCWTAMIDGLVRNGEMNQALEMFRDMQREFVTPNEFTIVCVLSACAQLGALELGKWVHSYAEMNSIQLNLFVSSALINMYSRCGSIDDAQQVFESLSQRDVTTYNAVLSGLALNGKATEAIETFHKMVKIGIRPNNVTFVAMLNACSHSGKVDLGFEMFNTMAEKYKIEPQIEHYGCMVDLLGRVGRVEEAYKFIQTMKLAPDHIIWGALLGACKVHGNLEIAKQSAKVLLDSGHADSGTYVLLSGAYASSRKWNDAAEVRARMKSAGIEKEPGCSLIEVKNEVHEFLLGDLRHAEKEAIYKKLDEVNEMLKDEGYCAETKMSLHDIEDQEKVKALGIHSERLAVCYGLISTEPNTTLRVVNNLRVCNDCHEMLKMVAKITRRKIIVRDRNRFHYIENGTCSCGDYW